jgi:hypothetical protein
MSAAAFAKFADSLWSCGDAAILMKAVDIDPRTELQTRSAPVRVENSICGGAELGFKGPDGALHGGFFDGGSAGVAEAEEDFLSALGFVQGEELDGVL